MSKVNTTLYSLESFLKRKKGGREGESKGGRVSREKGRRKENHL